MAERGFELVDREDRWQALVPALLAVGELAVDLEADGFHRYPERLSLIQVGLPDGRILLIDPLALSDLSALGQVLADPDCCTIFHSAAYDVRALDRDLDFRIASLYDTSIAAQMLGLERTGLANVLEEVLGVELDLKSKRLQRMDWSRRPLPDDAQAYAADDVAHLAELKAEMARRIADLGREAWVAEECRRQAAARYEPPEPPETAFLSLKGARDLSPRGRAILRELYVYREQAALRMGRPPHYVMHNSALLALSENPDQPLESVRGLGARGAQRRGKQIRAALARGKQADPVPWPRPTGRNPWTPEARQRLSALKGWRKREAKRLGLSVGLVWPAAHLDQIALYPDQPLHELDRGDDPSWVRDWQWGELGESLAQFVAEQGW